MMRYNGVSNKENVGAGTACSFTPLLYSLPYETDVISVKKLLFFSLQSNGNGRPITFNGFKMDIPGEWQQNCFS